MKIVKPIAFSMALAASALSTLAHAGPPVQVTFKNQGSADAVDSASGRNEMGIHTNASPKPRATVKSGDSGSYMVQSGLSPDSNYATVRYQIG